MPIFDVYVWLPSLATTSLLSAIVWFFRKWITARLTSSIQHEFDSKLVLLRAELRESEEKFKAQIREKEGEIAALRNGALSALTSRHAALDKRRLEAFDELWGAFVTLGPALGLAVNMEFFEVELVAERAESEPKIQQLFKELGSEFDIKALDRSAANKARPHVSPMTWAVYSTIYAVAMNGYIQWMVLKGGLGRSVLPNADAISKLIVSILPEYEERLKNHGPSVYQNILQSLEERLLEELQKMMTGGENDKANLEQASEIIKAAAAIHNTIPKTQSEAQLVAQPDF